MAKLRLQVQGDGAWTINISQPRWTSVEAAPQSYEGKGDGVLGPVKLRAGTYEAAMKHGGQRNFIVYLVKTDGTNTELLANAIGAYDGSKAIRVRLGDLFGAVPGDYLLAVSADGNWQIGVR